MHEILYKRPRKHRYEEKRKHVLDWQVEPYQANDENERDQRHIREERDVLIGAREGFKYWILEKARFPSYMNLSHWMRFLQRYAAGLVFPTNRPMKSYFSLSESF